MDRYSPGVSGSPQHACAQTCRAPLAVRVPVLTEPGMALRLLDALRVTRMSAPQLNLGVEEHRIECQQVRVSDDGDHPDDPTLPTAMTIARHDIREVAISDGASHDRLRGDADGRGLAASGTLIRWRSRRIVEQS